MITRGATLAALAAALACACGGPKEPARPVDRADGGAKTVNVAPQIAIAPAMDGDPTKDEPDASVSAEEPGAPAEPAFAEPKGKKPSRTVPRAQFDWGDLDDEAESAALDSYHESVRDEVAALVAEAEAGKPRLIALYVGNTNGWGCGCPWFVIPYVAAEAKYDDEFVIHVLADGLARIDYKVFGLFRLTGHYTGRRFDSDPNQEKNGKHAYPEFHVHGWCYLPPHQSHDQEYEAPLMREMRAAGAPLCKGTHWPKWIDITPHEKG